MNFSTFFSRLQKYDIWLIMLLAFLVRAIGLQWMDYTGFAEFYRDYYVVSGIMHGNFTLLGPPSMQHGFFFGPFYYYVFVPLFAVFNAHPVSLILTGVIISTLSVYAFFKLLGLWFNDRGAAIMGALLLAVSIYSLRLSSYVSNPNFLPLFVLWFFYHLTKILDRTAKVKDYIYLGIAFGLASQLHTTATVVLPVVAIIALVLSRTLPKFKSIATSILFCSLTYLPYLFFELTNSFQNTRRLFALGGSTLHGRNLSLSFLALWNFIQGTLTPFNPWYFYTNIQPNFLNAFVALAGAVCIGLIIYKIFKPETKPKPPVELSASGKSIIITWAIVGTLMLLLFNKAVHDHYLFILWPLPLIGLTLLALWTRAHFGVYKAVAAVFIVMSLLQIYSFYAIKHTFWQEFMPKYERDYKNDPSTPLIGA